MKSREYDALRPFFESPKHWHFEELVKRTGMSRSRLSHWLRIFIRKGIIRRVKPKRRQPYYSQVFGSPLYRQMKRMYALRLLTEIGFLEHLSKLKDADVVILFGSFSREDWYESSDIDLFILGDDRSLDIAKYERLLGREIQVHLFRKRHNLKGIEHMLPWIVTGDFIKGTIEDLGVDISAKV